MRFAWALLILLVTLPVRGEATACTPAELHAHLEQLKALVAACTQKESAAVCDSVGVGADDRVALPSGTRLMNYDWVRYTLDDAATNHKSSLELKAATARLDRELQEISSHAPIASAEMERDRSELNSILASREFPPPRSQSFWGRWWDDFVAWLNRQLAKTSGSGTHTNWAGVILICVVALAACGGLIWWFRRAVRKRYALPDGMGRADAQQQARMADWRAWLEEAQRFAAEGRWQDGIHRVYWAAVAQMESRGLWRHDAARTPREYLGLLALGSAQRGDLANLTRSLEMFWYGGQIAQQKDYEDARELLERLVRA